MSTKSSSNKHQNRDGKLGIPNISGDPKAVKAVAAMDAFFSKHKFTEKEQDRFFNAAMRCAAYALDGKEPPIRELNRICDICQDREMTLQDLGNYLEGCALIIKAMAKEFQRTMNAA